jgi:hypothetical protein
MKARLGPAPGKGKEQKSGPCAGLIPGPTSRLPKDIKVLAKDQESSHNSKQALQEASSSSSKVQRFSSQHDNEIHTSQQVRWLPKSTSPQTGSIALSMDTGKRKV